MALESIITQQEHIFREHISQPRILSGPYGSVLDEIDLVKYNSGSINWRLAFGDDSGRKLLEKTAREYAGVLEDGDLLALPTFGLAYTRIKELGNNIITKLKDQNIKNSAEFRAKLQDIDVPELERLINDLTGFTDAEIYSLVVKFNKQALTIGKNALQTPETAGKNLKLVATIAPYGDCYKGEGFTSIEDAVARHLEQINILKDHVDAFLFETNCIVEQAVSAARAGEHSGKPYIISFVVDENGYLKGSNRRHTVSDAIRIIDAEYIGGAKQLNLVTYGVNCSSEKGAKTALTKLRENKQEDKVKLLYLNASKQDQCQNEKQSHGHNNLASEHFATETQDIKILFPYITVVSGCCGIKPDYLPTLRQYVNAPNFAAID